MQMNKQNGFTLIEALVALMIAATALVVLMTTLGRSADIQHSLFMHDIAMQQAQNKLSELSLKPAQQDEQHGSIELAEIQLEWRSWTEKTMMDGFVRVNVSVQVPHEPDVALFLYRSVTP